ncbi:hypothetical protein B9Z19DRAFT_1069345 [Tuber borchii]|uniref:Uncharacterized protein n=1 Tax=Tuber borchii TaxID=42251 RepID=A0A2T6ZC19_TUBBO|nr:hypothetical protein B9Z19DRAFT_1069345 [Tuber borchii]
METVANPQPLPPRPIPSQFLAQNGWYLNAENLQALNSLLATEGQAREVWRLLSLYPVPEVLRWVKSRQQNLNSAPSNNLENKEPVKQEEETGQGPNELKNEPKKSKENGGWEQLDRDGEIPRMQGAAVQNSAGKAASARPMKQDSERQGSAFPPRNGNQSGGTSRANCAGSEQHMHVHEAPTVANPPTQWQQNEFTVRVGYLIRDRIDPDYWHAITSLFTRPASHGPGQRFVVTTTFALSFSNIISVRPSPRLDINGQWMHGRESSTHPPPPPPPSGAPQNSRWIDQTAPLPPRDPHQRSQSTPLIRAMEEVIHRVVYSMAREFEVRAGLPPGAIASVSVKLGIGEE